MLRTPFAGQMLTSRRGRRPSRGFWAEPSGFYCHFSLHFQCETCAPTACNRNFLRKLSSNLRAFYFLLSGDGVLACPFLTRGKDECHFKLVVQKSTVSERTLFVPVIFLCATLGSQAKTASRRGGTDPGNGPSAPAFGSFSLERFKPAFFLMFSREADTLILKPQLDRSSTTNKIQIECHKDDEQELKILF